MGPYDDSRCNRCSKTFTDGQKRVRTRGGRFLCIKCNDYTSAYNVARRGKYSLLDEKTKARARVAARSRRAAERAAFHARQFPVPVIDLGQPTECFYCGCRIVGSEWHLDHIVPLSRGGLHEAGNVVAACPECNLSKGALAWSDWMAKLADRFARISASVSA